MKNALGFIKKYWWALFAGSLFIFAIGFRLVLLPSLEEGRFLNPDQEEITSIDVFRYTELTSGENAEIPTLQAKQQLAVGEYFLNNVTYSKESDGSYSFREDTHLLSENAYAKDFNLLGVVNETVYLSQTFTELPFLDRSASYYGLNAYRSSGGGRVGTEDRFSIDYDLSKDGKFVGLLEAELVGSIEKDDNICRNCAELEFEIYYAAFEISSGELVYEEKLDQVTILMDNVWFEDIKNTNKIFLLTTNINSVPSGGEGAYETLLGNDLLNLTMNMSEHDVKSFTYMNDAFDSADPIIEGIELGYLLGTYNQLNIHAKSEIKVVGTLEDEGVIFITIDSQKYVLEISSGELSKL